MHLDDLPQDEPLPLGKGFRNVAVFQIKLIVDALRDLIFSPFSLLAFVIDALLKPPVKNSLSLALMQAGRRTDRIINLFGEYSKTGEFTIDKTIADVEMAVQREMEKQKKLDSK